MRLGDLDALKEVFSDWHNWHTVIGYGKVVFLDKLFEIIDNAPTVDIKDELAGAYNEGYMCGSREAEKARPQGEWSIDNRPNIDGLWKCSECNEHYPYKTKFCPNCGAKMKGGAV